jgi:hypothetical protein
MKILITHVYFVIQKISGIAHENDLAYASYDTYPVSDIIV